MEERGFLTGIAARCEERCCQGCYAFCGVAHGEQVDVEKLKRNLKLSISKHTDSYIQQKLSSIDEDLTDITS